jgi:hypothetical protein
MSRARWAAGATSSCYHSYWIAAAGGAVPNCRLGCFSYSWTDEAFASWHDCVSSKSKAPVVVQAKDASIDHVEAVPPDRQPIISRQQPVRNTVARRSRKVIPRQEYCISPIEPGAVAIFSTDGKNVTLPSGWYYCRVTKNFRPDNTSRDTKTACEPRRNQLETQHHRRLARTA